MGSSAAQTSLDCPETLTTFLLKHFPSARAICIRSMDRSSERLMALLTSVTVQTSIHPFTPEWPKRLGGKKNVLRDARGDLLLPILSSLLSGHRLRTPGRKDGCARHKQTLYRTGPESDRRRRLPLPGSKKSQVIIELMARFDEAANIACQPRAGSRTLT